MDISGENVRTHGASVPWMILDVLELWEVFCFFQFCEAKATEKNPCADISDFFLFASQSSKALNVWMVMIVATSTS